MNSFGIHWFRRDLRIAGNSALKWNWKQNQGKTLGVFFFDSRFLSRPDFSNHRFGFFLQTLKSLKEELREVGGDLIVLDTEPNAGFHLLFSKLNSSKSNHKMPTCVTFNKDYEPFARERDSKITRILEDLGITVHTERDHLLIEPDELRKDPKAPSFYQIYTPFSKKWFSILADEEIQNRITIQKEAISYLEKRDKGEKIEPLFKLNWNNLIPEAESFDTLDHAIRQNLPLLKIELPKAGSLAAFRAAKHFQPKIKSYLIERDFPSRPGTSQMSIYLKNGSISSSILLQLLKLKNIPTQASSTHGGETQYLKELVWREFYYHILFHCPRVENEAFHSKYNNIAWKNRESWFEAWKEGKTGFPIVDAGMRELKTTGWMHNRVRMIVASFLTKDLLIDWKWGEKYFMNQLLDGDLAPNNGGWQWAASTGCDPQPYFRIFNPLLQSEKFDPNGEYIKKHIPELRHVSHREIHLPNQNYIAPIVDHAVQKLKAIQLYKSAL